MSYDITVGTKDFNYTSNMGRFFAEFDVRPRDMHGQPPHEVAQRIAVALGNIARFPLEDLRRDFDSANGWGNVEGATRFLVEVYMACITEPDVDAVLVC